MKNVIFVFLIVLTSCLNISSLSGETKFVPLENSYGHKDYGTFEKSRLNPQMNLTLTIVTDSLTNTKRVTQYYSSLGYFYIYDETDMHVKISGSVVKLSLVFNTSFVEVDCQKNMGSICYASTSEVYIPIHLRTAILGIIGLERVLTFKSSDYLVDQNKKSSTLLNTFSASIQEVEQFYGLPKSNGLGVKIGIVSLGGYFSQNELQTYFNQLNMGTAPFINTIVVDGAQLDYSDPNSIMNLIVVKIIAILVPKATITFFFAPATAQGFYASEASSSAYWSISEQLLSKYGNIPFFVSTGNNGSTEIGFPASCPSAIGENILNISLFETFMYLF